MKKTITIALISIFIFSACAVKQDDTLTTKTLKHTANAPVYVIAGVGMAATLALQGTLIGTAKLLGVKSKKEKEAEELAKAESIKLNEDNTNLIDEKEAP